MRSTESRAGRPRGGIFHEVFGVPDRTSLCGMGEEIDRPFAEEGFCIALCRELGIGSQPKHGDVRFAPPLEATESNAWRPFGASARNRGFRQIRRHLRRAA